EVAGQTGGYLYMTSSVPVYTVATIGASNAAFLASLPPNLPPAAFRPGAVTAVLEIVRVEPSTDVPPGTRVRITTINSGNDATFVLGGQTLNSQQVGPGVEQYTMVIPAIEPGSANLVLRSNGLESQPVALHVLLGDSGPTQTIAGAAFYQKIDVTNDGLDLNHPVMVPVRSARVEVFSTSTQQVVAVSETDVRGRFSVPVPFDPNLNVRVISRLRSSDLRVADNTNSSALYMIGADVDGRESRSDLILTDRTRTSG